MAAAAALLGFFLAKASYAAASLPDEFMSENTLPYTTSVLSCPTMSTWSGGASSGPTVTATVSASSGS
eukprot:CAMPEP_0115422022 /NCGR_PEP_ID=MMETSP0271-20121206/26554_1 /TAXON_ID=71861 /ORGANISM="Scrippsiella trochoidea, Strain CCMP3099" /LENGTH=67 /DNA_ID=CAMNT_0002846685 /DNA_START=10 /DNA_END=209 /DNA_ORIENTATION=+